MDYMDELHSHHFDDVANATDRAEALRGLIRDQESLLLQPLLDFLADRKGVRLIGKAHAAARAPTVSFSTDRTRSQHIAAKLAEKNIGAGAGDFYAYRLVEALGYDNADGVVRTSFVHYTSPEEVTRLIEALDQLV